MNGFWKRALKSGWVAYGVLMGGAVMFEALTRPWRSSVIPSPYLLLYGMAVYICSTYGFRYGLVCSLTWFPGSFCTGIWLHHNPAQVRDAEIVRLVLHGLFPWIVSRPYEAQREAEEARLRADHQRNELLRVLRNGVAHEFNNLFMITMGRAAALREHLAPEHQTDADDIVVAAERGARLVRSIRHHAFLGQISPELLDVSKLIAELEEGRTISADKTAHTAQ